MPRIVGTGLAALDLIVAEDEIGSGQFIASGGGTCGNVLAALSALGWQSTFVGAVRHSPVAGVVHDDLNSLGVQVELSFSDEGSIVPVIVEHVSHSRDLSNVRHWFSSQCPWCRKELPRFSRPTDAAWQTHQHLSHFPDVFFADRLSATVVRFAHAARERGALVMYEPSTEADSEWMRDMLSIAHVVKFSADYSSRLKLTPAREGLWIETQGAAGLSFKRHGENHWQSFPAELAARVIDTCGAGDWFTAGLLFSLFQSSTQPRAASEGHVVEALRRGARLAAWSCGFLGARGPLYDADAVDAWVAIDGTSYPLQRPQRARPRRPQVPADLWGHCERGVTAWPANSRP